MRCVAPPSPKMMGATFAPSVFTRLRVPQALAYNSTRTLLLCTSVALAEISTPLFVTEPRLWNRELPQPQVGGSTTAIRASCETLEKYVNPSCMLIGRTSVSNPNSTSLVRSGLSAGLPSPPIVMPGTSVLLMTTGVGLKNGNASVGPGCNPDAPYAARSFSDPSQPGVGKNGSSDTTHEP